MGLDTTTLKQRFALAFEAMAKTFRLGFCQIAMRQGFTDTCFPMLETQLDRFFFLR